VVVLCVRLRAALRRYGAGDLAHGIVEGQAEHLDMEVNGVAGQIAFRPTPIMSLMMRSGKAGKTKLPASRSTSFESALLEERNQRGERAARISSRDQRGP